MPGTETSPRRRIALTSALALLLVLVVTGAPTAFAAGGRTITKPLIGHNTKTDCVYAADSVSVLQTFQTLVGRTFNCALVYNDAAPTWAAWEKPWFVTDGQPSYSWATWATTPGTSRELIITNELFPSSLNGTDWLQRGANGAFAGHARALARNLVAAGLGNAVIRLAHEANGTWYPYSLGTTSPSLHLWAEFWRRTALAMRSVPGAHFLFDWCINAYWRPIPLNEWYPGNDVVDIIGIDTYDGGVPVGSQRWSRLYNQPDGIGAVIRFATAHRKPISIPEWGLWPTGPGTLGGGNDPSYIAAIASVVRHNQVAYQSYFYNHDPARLLGDNPLSLAAYRLNFGGGGPSAGARTH